MKPILLNLEPDDYSEEAIRLLSEHFEYRELHRDQPLQSQIIDAEVIITRLNYNIDETLIGDAKQLKYLLTATTGTNHIDEVCARERGVQVISLKGETTFLNKITPTAEHTWGLLLALYRNYFNAFTDVLNHHWDRDAHLGQQLLGKTIGIVGLGRLGKMVAGYAKAFGMNVIYNDIVTQDVDYEQVELLKLMSLSDVVSIHLPLNTSTKEIINSDCFSVIKNNAALINTSRGEVIEEAALLSALISGRLYGAALDVIANEASWQGKVPASHPLLDYAKTHANLLITPHIGGACPDAMRMTENFIANKLISTLLESD